jgi:succinate dehydrogenase / fumarate reductase, flavoprotein subunit
MPRAAKDLASRDVVSRAMTIEIREGRGVGPANDHLYLHLEHLGAEPCCTTGCRAFPNGAHLLRRRRDPRADPGAADGALQHGRHSTTYMGEAVAPANGNHDATVPGLLAVGETACASVHGANRLGSNSLTDLVVFGRAAALKCAETIERSAAQAELPATPARPRSPGSTALRHANGSTPTAELRGDAARHAGLLRGVPHGPLPRGHQAHPRGDRPSRTSR